MSRLVQLVITTDQARYAEAAIRDAGQSEEITAAQSDDLYNLSRIFDAAATQPEKFPLTGKRASSLKRRVERGLQA